MLTVDQANTIALPYGYSIQASDITPDHWMIGPNRNPLCYETLPAMTRDELIAYLDEQPEEQPEDA